MEDDIHLIEYYYIIKKRFIWIALFVLCCLILTFLYSKNCTKIYQSSSVILVMGGDQSGSSIMSKVAMLTGDNNLSSSGNSLSSNLSVVLASRTLAEQVVNKLDLTKYYYKDDWDIEHGQWKPKLKKVPTIHDVAKILLSNIYIKKDAANPSVFNFSVNDEDPSMSVKINKAYLVELQNYLNDNTLTNAKRQKNFIESQLLNSKKEVLEVGKELGTYYTQNHINTSSALAEVSLSMPDASFVAETSKVLNMNDDNTALLQQQKTDLDEKIKSARVKNVPLQVYFEYLVQKRLILIKLNSTLSEQYEVAKMNAAKDDISFLVVDEAIVPQFPAWPNTKKNLLFAFCLSIFVSCFAVFFVEYLQNARSKVK